MSTSLTDRSATRPRSAPLCIQRSFDDMGTPLYEATFCIVDFETTGGNRNDDLITEIGAVKVRGGEVLGTFHTLVNPGRAIPPSITILTGLSDAIVAQAPRIEAVLGTFMDFLGDGTFVAHNASFDLSFLRAALERDGRSEYRPMVVDTAMLARRLLRDETPNFKLSTLASRLRLDHTPTHRALDDALATTDLLHLLLERAAGLGVLALDDLVSLSKLAGHPQAGKLNRTINLPRSPGVYLFRGARDEVLYVGKATNLRQRVRSYFGRDDRRKIGPMLREMQRVDHLELADPLTAAVIESRLISRMLPRYNRAGTRTSKYAYVKLDTESAWPRLSVIREPSTKGDYLGPLPSRAAAQLVVEAMQSALSLRRCTARLSASYQPPANTSACSAAQLGVAQCPCAGAADRVTYDAAVAAAADTLGGDAGFVVATLRARLVDLAGAQRFEEAAMVRDRANALLSALRRQALADAVVAAGRATVTRGDHRWTIDHGRLVDVEFARQTPASGAFGLAVEPPAAALAGQPLHREQIDEAILLANHFQRHAYQLRVESCTGEWRFPIDADDALHRLDAPVRDCAVAC